MPLIINNSQTRCHNWHLNNLCEYANKSHDAHKLKFSGHILAADSTAPASISLTQLPSEGTVLGKTTQKLGSHRHQTLPRYHNAASHALPYGPLRPNVTSSIKLEEHNITMPPEEDRATATGYLHTKFCEKWPSGSRDMLVDRHTHTYRHTNRQADYNTTFPYQGGVIMAMMPFKVIWSSILVPMEHQMRLPSYHRVLVKSLLTWSAVFNLLVCG